MEFLKGMKFMQRSEEAKRRELFQAEQEEDLRQQLQQGHSSSSSDAKHSSSLAQTKKKGPTIVVDDSYRYCAVGRGRKTFKGSECTNVIVEEAPQSASDVFSSSGVMGEVDFIGTSAAASRSDLRQGQEELEAPRKDDSAAPPKRFTVTNSVRAPKLPKTLELHNQQLEHKRKREREEEDEKNDFSMF